MDWRGQVRILAMAVLCAALSGAAPGGVIRHDRSDSRYLSLAQRSAFDCVGRLDASGGWWGTDQWMGSGTLIAPEWVLTAGHMLDEAQSMSFDVAGQTVWADWGVSHPYWWGDLTSGYDLALIHLSEPVWDVEPAERYYGSSERGATATFVGFGMTGDGWTGAVDFDGQKRAGQNVIDRFYGSRLLLADFDNPEWGWWDNVYGSDRALNLEYLIAPGDSGGGVFIDFGDGPLLAGVNSFGASWDGATDSDYGDVSGHVRVSRFNRWIDETIGDSSDWWGPHDARGVPGQEALPMMTRIDLRIGTGVPEPATLALLACGAAVALRRRRA